MLVAENTFCTSTGSQWGGWIVEMEDILHLSGEECFVCAFLGSFLGADKALQRQN